MNHAKIFFICVVLSMLSACASSSRAKRLSDAELWAVAPGPALQSLLPESVGAHAAGCLSGGKALESDGPGYSVMRPSRKRFFGHPTLIHFVEVFSQAALKSGLGTLLIGDMSQPRGGPMKSGHRSHQTGLDVDIWFRVLPLTKKKFRAAVLAMADRETMGSPSVVDRDRLHAQHWGKHAATLLALATERPEVDRIFVNPVIKRELCIQLSASERTWLRKIRPWWGHDSHFHVRLRCPEGAALCRPADELPPGDGCDETLNWWFSEEAAELAKSSGTAEPPILPAECEPILDQP